MEPSLTPRSCLRAHLRLTNLSGQKSEDWRKVLALGPRLQAQAGLSLVLLCAAAARMAPLEELDSWLSEGLLHISLMTK